MSFTRLYHWVRGPWTKKEKPALPRKELALKNRQQTQRHSVILYLKKKVHGILLVSPLPPSLNFCSTEPDLFNQTGNKETGEQEWLERCHTAHWFFSLAARFYSSLSDFFSLFVDACTFIFCRFLTRRRKCGAVRPSVRGAHRGQWNSRGDFGLDYPGPLSNESNPKDAHRIFQVRRRKSSMNSFTIT